jgi:2-polyprenyl-6-methoxyphenol hydroxylase-like FAD-dependent oxidoreductase
MLQVANRRSMLFKQFIISCRFLLAADGASSSVRKNFDAVYAGCTASSQWRAKYHFCADNL